MRFIIGLIFIIIAFLAWMEFREFEREFKKMYSPIEYRDEIFTDIPSVSR